MNEEKIQCYKRKSIEELDEILNNPNSTESDIIIATFEKHEKEEMQGTAIYYTTEEVVENVFGGKFKMA